MTLDKVGKGIVISYYVAVISLVIFTTGYFMREYLLSLVDKLGFSRAVFSPLVLFASFTIVCIVARYEVMRVSRKTNILHRISNSINNWLIVTIFLVISVVAVGSILLSSKFGIGLPSEGEFFIERGQDQLVNLSKVTCISDSGYSQLVAGDVLKCYFDVSYLDNSFGVLNIEVIQYYSDRMFNQTYFQEYSGQNLTKNIAMVNLKENEGRVHAWIYARFTDNNFTSISYKLEFTKPILQKEEYFDRQSQMLPMIIALLSFASVSVVVAMKNLKDIAENKK
ncbi:MAG TPA: hypothetical protein VKE88_03695 [Candidatus Nanoarchaeia archaeon]|nr:hypothetical protein [Candidatus Nanoarchaeia archaeon]